MAILETYGRERHFEASTPARQIPLMVDIAILFAKGPKLTIGALVIGEGGPGRPRMFRCSCAHKYLLPRTSRGLKSVFSAMAAMRVMSGSGCAHPSAASAKNRSNPEGAILMNTPDRLICIIFKSRTEPRGVNAITRKHISPVTVKNYPGLRRYRTIRLRGRDNAAPGRRPAE
jgi:hypothetical protein